MNELYELIQQKEQVKLLIQTIEEQIKEYEELKKIVENTEGKIYLQKGFILLESNKEEVLKKINEKIEGLKLQLERYKKRLEYLNEKIKQLR